MANGYWVAQGFSSCFVPSDLLPRLLQMLIHRCGLTSSLGCCGPHHRSQSLSIDRLSSVLWGLERSQYKTVFNHPLLQEVPWPFLS